MQKKKYSLLIFRRSLLILECPKGTRKPDEIVNTSLLFHHVFTQCHVYYKSSNSCFSLSNVAYWTNATMIFTLSLNERSLCLKIIQNTETKQNKQSFLPIVFVSHFIVFLGCFFAFQFYILNEFYLTSMIKHVIYLLI